jgi:hypothetical protein
MTFIVDDKMDRDVQLAVFAPRDEERTIDDHKNRFLPDIRCIDHRVPFLVLVIGIIKHQKYFVDRMKSTLLQYRFFKLLVENAFLLTNPEDITLVIFLLKLDDKLKRNP